MIDPIVETTNTKQSEEMMEQFLDETADNILNLHSPQGFPFVNIFNRSSEKKTVSQLTKGQKDSIDPIAETSNTKQSEEILEQVLLQLF